MSALNSQSDADTGAVRASFGRRLGAIVIDGVLCALVAALIARPPGSWSTLVFLIAYSIFIGFFAQSPGMRLLGMRCVGVADGRPIGYYRALLRTLLILVLIPAVLGAPDGRRWHDRIVGTDVVRVS